MEKLLTQLNGLVTAGHTVLVVEHNLRVIDRSDWVIEIGPGAGDEGGKIVAQGTPAEISENADSATAPYLDRFRKGSAPN